MNFEDWPNNLLICMNNSRDSLPRFSSWHPVHLQLLYGHYLINSEKQLCPTLQMQLTTHHSSVQVVNHSASSFIFGFRPHRFTSMASSAYTTSETVSVEALISTLVLLYLPSLLVYVLFSQVAVSMCFRVHIRAL